MRRELVRQRRPMAETVIRETTLFVGNRQPTFGERGKSGEQLEPYLSDAGIIEAVQVAQRLKRPLLLKGEPGCGKTRLAKAVAYELDVNYYEWHVKSTSRARDGLYMYDTVARLRDAQLAAAGRLDGLSVQELDDPWRY